MTSASSAGSSSTTGSGDPDGLVAPARHLLSPTNRMAAVTSSFLDPIVQAPPGAASGALVALELVDVIGGPAAPTVHEGSETPFGSGDATSAASPAIGAAAHVEDALPPNLVCGGPLIDVAAAPRQDRGIVERLILVWTGGALDPAAPEYERAAFTSLPLHDVMRLGGIWPLGDSPPLLVTALGDESSTFTVTPATATSAAQRVYTDVDVRLLVGDLLARLRLHEAARRAGPEGETR